jgi:hypothetical protein
MELLCDQLSGLIHQCEQYESCHLIELPFSMVVAGPTRSGKTTYIKNLLDQDHLKGDVILFYGTDQPLYEQMPIKEKYLGLDEFPQVVDNLDRGRKNIIIIDDLMQDIGKNKHVSEVVTSGVSHCGLTLILVYQNLLPQDKYSRTIAMNCTYKACFYNNSTAGQFKHVVREMADGQQTLKKMYRNLPPNTPLVIDSLHHRAWYGVDPEFVIELKGKP